VVAAAGPAVAVGRGEQRVDLFVAQVRDDGLLAAFGWVREDARDRVGVLGVPECGVVKQRADRGQSRVARGGAVGALVLEVIEERADQVGVEMLEV
jgi:hypothetical protein